MFSLAYFRAFLKSRMRNQSQKRGVKAIILYPMNALATDQLKRVRKIFGDDEIEINYRHVNLKNF